MFKRIRNTISYVFSSRLFVLMVIFCVLSCILIHRVFTLQIVNGQDYLDNYKMTIKKTKEIQGTRGNIYDRNGKVLATNRLAYSVQIEDNGSYDDAEQKNQLINATVLRVIDIVQANGDQVTTDFGIELNEKCNYSFVYAKGTRRLRFLADIYGLTTIDKLTDQQKNAKPQDVIDFLCAGKREKDYGFGIDQTAYSKKQVLELVAIRYDMHLNNYQKYIPTTIASDVSDETVAVIMENLSDLQGISIGEESLRVYPDSKYFASLIGYTGKISQDEYDALSKKDKKIYYNTDIIGKSGIEQTMDKYLRGTKGSQEVYVNSVGKVIESEAIVEPKAGNDVYLTIDKDYQITAYKLIEEKLAGIILRKMSNQLDYNRNPDTKNANIIIPIGDIYYSFIGNEIIDRDHIAQSEASSTEKAVYQSYQSRQKQAISKIMDNMSSKNGTVYKQCTKEMQAYLNYIASDLLTSQTGILDADKIDTGDKTYLAWKNETINLYEYLNHAISQNWVDSSVLTRYLQTDEKYSDAKEVYKGILAYLKDYLKTDTAFEKLVYRYMIKDGTVSGTQICLILYDQEILKYDEVWYNRLLSGYSPYEFIRTKLKNLEITPGQLGVEPSTGSIVMTETSTGNTLACVSYPGYDNNRLANTMDTDYYYRLQVDMSSPFYNKATQEKTAPGSTFKMVSSSAGLMENVISAGTLLRCSGPYKNVTPSPKCWIYPGAHGNLNVVNAIAHSCNNFYYDVGYKLGLTKNGLYSSETGIAKLTKYAKMFGLNEKSGLEIEESEPRISDEDAVRSAIGQGTHNYTTSQLAKYVTGIANKGTVYNLTLLSKVTDVEGKVIKEYKPKVYKQISEKEISSSAFSLIHQGMSKMVERDERFNSVRAGHIKMSGKTGTAQQSATHADHVLFVGFAPSDDPQIAVAVRITNGYSSGYAAELGRDMVRKYFKLAKNSELLSGKAASLGTESHAD